MSTARTDSMLPTPSECNGSKGEARKAEEVPISGQNRSAHYTASMNRANEFGKNSYTFSRDMDDDYRSGG